MLSLLIILKKRVHVEAREGQRAGLEEGSSKAERSEDGGKSKGGGLGSSGLVSDSSGSGGSGLGSSRGGGAARDGIDGQRGGVRKRFNRQPCLWNPP
jgi:hypothetical protein